LRGVRLSANDEALSCPMAVIIQKTPSIQRSAKICRLLHLQGHGLSGQVFCGDGFLRMEEFFEELPGRGEPRI